MPKILAADTTSEFGSIAIYDGEGDRTTEISLHSPEGFGHILFGRIRDMLDREGLGIANIDCFAAASGPGSFTGVRVGLTAMKGLAEAAGKPVAAVSNLKALASFGSGPLRATVIDARRGEIYGAVYGPALETVQPEVVTRFPNWLDGLPDGDIEFIGTNLAPFVAALDASRFRHARIVEWTGTLAAAVARVAHAGFLRGESMDPAAADANYVRRSDAELFWKEA